MTRFADRRLDNRLAGFGSGPFRIIESGVSVSSHFCTKELIMKFIQFIQKFASDEEGVTAIEYGLIAALIAVVIIASVEAVGGGLSTVFQSIADKIAPAAPATP